MDSQAKSGALSILTAIAAAIAPAVVKAVLSRRSRVPIKEGEQEMCRNHSHVTGRIFSLKEEEEFTEVRILVTQPLTVEAINGAKLTLPKYCVCSLRLDKQAASSASDLHKMAAQDEWALSRDELIITSGPITQPK